jgi:hypothetical protein
MAEVVKALASKLTDEAKADMLGVVRSGLAAVDSGDAASRWARAYEALLPPSSAIGYIGAIVEVLKYPTSSIKKRRPSEDELRRNLDEYAAMDATEYFQKKISERFPDAKELQSGNLADLVDWIGENYPDIDLTRPPVRSNVS